MIEGRDITEEVEQETGSAGPNYVDQDPSSASGEYLDPQEDAGGPMTSGAAGYPPMEDPSYRRQRSLEMAAYSYGQGGQTNTDAVIERATRFERFITGTDKEA